jgi:hypothetical protein
MVFGFVNKARDNKENILYAIVTIVLLERVRTGWNKIESRGRKSGMGPLDIRMKQWRFLVNAALLYAIPFLLPVVKYVFRSIEELSWSVPGLVVLQSTWAFFTILVLAECFLALIIFNLLKIYIDRMNGALSFFAKIGRNIWDGSKMAVSVSSDVGSRVAAGVRNVSAGALFRTRSVSKRTAAAVLSAPGRIRRYTWRRLSRNGRSTRRLESPTL